MLGGIYFGQIYPAGNPLWSSAAVHYLAPPERRLAVPAERRRLAVPAELRRALVPAEVLVRRKP